MIEVAVKPQKLLHSSKVLISEPKKSLNLPGTRLRAIYLI